MRRSASLIALCLLVMSLSSLQASADPVTAPSCNTIDTGSGAAIPVIDEAVLQWKREKPDSFRTRAHVQGTLTKIYPGKNGHLHFQIQIGPQATDTLEVIYNMEFGQVPQLHQGMTVEACGDYITSRHQHGYYPGSPDGAIIHWVHRSPQPFRHPSGFLIFDGVLCGYGKYGH